MTKHLVAEMITLARHANLMTQGELAEGLGYSAAKMSKIENGLVEFPPGDLRRLAELLGQDPEFFFQRPPIRMRGSDVYHKRSLKSASPRKAKALDCRLDITQLRVGWLLGDLPLDVIDGGFDPIDIEAFDGTPEEIAQRIRRRWGIRTGPVLDLTDRVERAGAVVVVLDFGTLKEFGRSHHDPKSLPMIALNRAGSADQKRFTLAHEVGHLIMHPDSSSHGNAEKEADRFAAELLMPAQEIAPELSLPLTIQRLAALKRTWRVSMQALIRRAHDLGIISAQRYRSLNIEISRRGWRKKEPFPIEDERPRLLEDVIEYYREQGRSLDDLARQAKSSLGSFVREFLPGRSPFRVLE